jgi:hypothetical protein
VQQLVAYLAENIILDFQGDLSLDTVREFLKDDKSPFARNLIARLVADGSADDMMICLADCLQDYIKSGINPDTIHEQVRLYAEA